MLFAASVLAADVAAGLAARLDAGLNWDLIDLVQRGRHARRQAAGARRLGLRRRRLEERRRGSRSSAPAPSSPPTAAASREVADVAVELEDFSTKATMVEQAHEEQSGPSIEDADIIVAGGRGLGGPENFALVEELAKALGGAVAATRAVVDAGWYPYSTQVGQTGKTVSPKLYIACGISGAIQHKVGMQSSNVIVAINKDANAPIFEFSDLGVVGDLHEIVPKLTELVRARKGGLMGAVPARLPAAVRPRGRARRARPTPIAIEVGDPRSSAPGRPGSPARSASASCSRSTRRSPSGSARCRSRCSRRASSPARTCSPARSSTRARLQRLFRDRKRIDELPFLRRGRARVGLLPDAEARAPDPDAADDAQPRQLRRLALAARPLPRASEAEAGGATILPETAAEKLLVARRARRAACAPATRAAAATASSCRTSSRARTSLARVTVLAEGTQGHLTGAAIERFGLRGDEPAGLGARRQGGLEGREAARPRDPHDGLAAAARREVPRVRRLVHLPDGRRHGHDRDGRRARLPRRRALGARPAAGAEDASEADPRDPRGRRAARVGREDDPRGRVPLAAEAAERAGAAARAATAPASSTCRR